MSPIVQTVTTSLAALTILGQVGIVLLVIRIIAKKPIRPLDSIVEKSGVMFVFLLALGGSLGSIFYSEFAGFIPCVLCWYQRILLFPQVVILGAVHFKKEAADGAAQTSAIILSLVGTLIALYNYYIQFGGVSIVPCAASGGFSCQIRYFVEFGYVTIPMMSLTTFVLIFLILLLQKKLRTEK